MMIDQVHVTSITSNSAQFDFAHHVILKLDTSRRYAFYFGLDTNGAMFIKTGAFDRYTVPGAGYHDFEVTYDPAVSTGALIYVDGSLTQLNPSPYLEEGSNSGVPQALQFGSSVAMAEGVAEFNLVEWELLNRPTCLDTVGVYTGCMDSRYDNFDSAAGIQQTQEQCRC